MQERWQEQMLARRYTRDVIARAIIRQTRHLAHQLLHDVYFAMVDDFVDDLSSSEEDTWVTTRAERQKTIDGFQQFAARLKGRQVLHGPGISDEDRGLPAAFLADRNRRQLNMTRLRLISGEEVAIKVPGEASLHDFCIQVRNTLGLQKHISLALLRVGPGGFDNRLLSCSRHINAGRHVRKTVFEVVLHK